MALDTLPTKAVRIFSKAECAATSLKDQTSNAEGQWELRQLLVLGIMLLWLPKLHQRQQPHDCPACLSLGDISFPLPKWVNATASSSAQPLQLKMEKR